MSAPPRAFRFGQQTLEFEEPDLLVFRLSGTVQAEELRAMRQAQTAWQQGKDHVLVLIDITRLVGTTQEARKECLRDDGGPKRRALVAFGGSFPARIISQLVFRSLRMVGFDQSLYMMAPDEARARTWLAERRAAFTSSA